MVTRKLRDHWSLRSPIDPSSFARVVLTTARKSIASLPKIMILALMSVLESEARQFCEHDRLERDLSCIFNPWLLWWAQAGFDEWIYRLQLQLPDLCAWNDSFSHLMPYYNRSHCLVLSLFPLSDPTDWSCQRSHDRFLAQAVFVLVSLRLLPLH